MCRVAFTILKAQGMGIIEVGVKEWQLDERHVTSTARPKYLLLDLNHSTGGRVFNAS